MRVAFLDDFHCAYQGTMGIQRLRERAEVEIFTAPFGDPCRLRGFNALVATRERTRFTKELMEQLPDVRIIAQTGNHAYHIDLPAAEERGIVIGKATGGACHAAGELAIALMLALTRQIPFVDRAVKAGGWPTPMTRVLRRKTLGIVGLGNVGRYVAGIANAFEMKILAWGARLTKDAAAASGAEQCDLDDLMRFSDVVSVHATLSPASRGLLDARRLALMKPTAYLVNTSRGPIVDEAALCSALTDRRIAGAALDVFDQEPLPADHPLRQLPNVILTSHIGWPTDEMYAQFADAAADVLIAFAEGRDVSRFVARH